MTNYEKLFADEVTNWLINVSGFKQPQYQMYIYYKYAPDGPKLVALSYVYDCVFWYIPEELGKCFVDTLEKIYAHWFKSIRISQLKDYLISV